jgi:outer membrane protein OmpA-like peptidoglycan-associated protein
MTMTRTTLLAMWLAAALPAPFAAAVELKTEDIICALNPKCTPSPSRGWSRGVTKSGGKTVETYSIDLYVNFAYNSAELTSDARITLDRLGSALSDGRLQGFTFLIAGHTDAKGGAEYNQRLSERRAATVRTYLVEQYGVAPSNLSAKGFGKSQLLDPDRPEDGVNRRVQVVNTTASPQN